MDWRHPRSREQVGSMMMLPCGREGTVQPLQTPWGTLNWEGKGVLMINTSCCLGYMSSEL